MTSLPSLSLCELLQKSEGDNCMYGPSMTGEWPGRLSVRRTLCCVHCTTGNRTKVRYLKVRMEEARKQRLECQGSYQIKFAGDKVRNN